MNYIHKEAYCLMIYKCEACNVIEVLWNSRDGVTPFVINCRSCNEAMQHDNWNLDVCVPDYKPFNGQRQFIDCTFKKFQELTRKKIDKWWKENTMQIKGRYTDRYEALIALSKDFQEKQPTIIITKTNNDQSSKEK